ncbi:MAG: hypothetical protein PHV39_06195 [Methanomicrobium sp.]|nr:hypothetical protein [Methanomicrobium sp.]
MNKDTLDRRIKAIEEDRNTINPVRIVRAEDLTDEQLNEIVGGNNLTDEELKKIARGADVVIIDDI